MPKQILHDAHKAHPLLHGGNGTSFRCDGCHCRGAGFRYRCDACDFNLHEFCATCAPTARFSFHGQHPLVFEPAVFAEEPRDCDLCNAPIKGMHYRCRPCDLDMHPVCSQLPAAAVSPLHPEHLVTLAAGAPGKCARCDARCLWRYRCADCKVNLHAKCLLGTEQTPLCIPKDDYEEAEDSTDADKREEESDG